MKLEMHGLSPQREWPNEVAPAPADLVKLVEDAMVDFGPDRHCDGADEIAALVVDWLRKAGWKDEGEVREAIADAQDEG